MKVAIIGTRGIPNNYGGFEQLAEILSVKLVQLGCDVTVYNSSLHPYKKAIFHGVKLISCYDPESWMGTAGQFIYDFNCILNTRKQNFDVVVQLGYTSSSIWNWLFKKSVTVLTNMDGLEWKRTKYSKLTKQFLIHAEKLAVKHSSVLIADSLGIKKYLYEKYKTNATYIAYGSEIQTEFNESGLDEFKITKENYFLIIARLEPENNIDVICEGYINSKSNLPLIIVGGLTTSHARYLISKYANTNIRFVGSIYNQLVLNNLRHYCKIYFHGHSVGGTNPSLIEAMAAKANIIAYNCIFNDSILNNNASYFLNSENVSVLIVNFEYNKVNTNKEINFQKVIDLYNWKNISEAYYTIIKNCAEKNRK